jgi:hypothetical protein
MLELLKTLLQILVVVLVPLLVSRIVLIMIRKIAHEEFFQVPILSILARLQGIIAGILVIQLDFDRQYFDIEQIFLSDGPWSLDLSQFLLERANLFVYDLSSIINLLVHTSNYEENILAILVAVILPFLILILSFFFWEFSKATQAIIASVMLVMLASWLTIYLISAALWLLHILNFWSLVLLVMYLRYRQDKSVDTSWWPW